MLLHYRLLALELFKRKRAGRLSQQLALVAEGGERQASPGARLHGLPLCLAGMRSSMRLYVARRPLGRFQVPPRSHCTSASATARALQSLPTGTSL
jgi:hypothetical protein